MVLYPKLKILNFSFSAFYIRLSPLCPSFWPFEIVVTWSLPKDLFQRNTLFRGWYSGWEEFRRSYCRLLNAFFNLVSRRAICGAAVAKWPLWNQWASVTGGAKHCTKLKMPQMRHLYSPVQMYCYNLGGPARGSRVKEIYLSLAF